MSDIPVKIPILCDNDKKSSASEYCAQCKRHFCTLCSKVLHKKPDFRTHVRTSFQDIKCSNDQEEAASSFCKECDTFFCGECDEVIHMDPSISSHNRSQIDINKSGEIPPPSPSLSENNSPALARKEEPPLASSTEVAETKNILLGKYELENLSQWGGRNEVKVGVDILTNEHVALKIVTDLTQFDNEVEMLKKLRSDHVVKLLQIHKASELEGILPNAKGVIVMERLQERLRERLKRKLDFMGIRNIAGQIGICLEFLHSERVVHCDIKPENLMRKDDTWKLIDLDNAKKIGETVTSLTPAYCSPEVAIAHVEKKPINASPAMDVWAFGVILFEMLTGGTFEFLHGKTDEEMLSILSSKEMKIPFAKVADEQARHLLQKALVIDPQERTTMQEIMRHAYFRGGLDTTQKSANISRISQHLHSIKADTGKILNQLEALRVQLLETSEFVIPRLFIIVPSLLGKNSWSNPNHWGMNTFKLHLLCEHDQIHMTAHPGYPILDPKPFVRKAAPIVSALCKILNVSSQAAVGGSAIPPAVIDKLNTMNIRPTEYLEFLSNMVDNVSETKNANLQSVRGQGLRELKVFLDKHDPGQIYGRLEKVVLPDGHVRWLCPEHSRSHIVEKVEKPNLVIPLPPVIPPTKTLNQNEPKKSGLRDVKIVALGSGGTYKSPLTVQFVQGVFVEKYDPTIEDSYRKQIEFEGQQLMLEILDTAGTDQFTAMRDLYMKNGHGFILCFNLNAMSTFNDLPDLYEQILRVKDVDSTPAVIAGMLLTAEHDPQRVISSKQGEELAKKLDASYVEVYIREKVNVELVFETLIRTILNSPQSNSLTKTKKSGGGIRKLFGNKPTLPSSSNEPVVSASHIVDKVAWRTAIHKAVMDDDVEKLISVLQKENNLINAQDNYLKTALHYACAKPENLHVIKLLLEAGSSLSVCDSLNNTPIHTFTDSSTHLPTWEFLAMHAANTLPNVDFFFDKNKTKQSPLALALKKDSFVPAFIEVLAKKMSVMTEPCKFDVSELKLYSIPESVFGAKAISFLDLHNNYFKNISPDIGNMVNLVHLDFSANVVTDSSIDPSIRKCTNLSRLKAERNKFTKIPDSIFALHSLTLLNFAVNDIEKVDDGIGNLTKLETLHLRGNKIKQVSGNINKLVELQDLDLAHNQIGSFPSTTNLFKLQKLNLDRNQLTDLAPVSTSLSLLHLAGNQLSSAPSLSRHAKLEKLFLDNNRFTSLSEETFGTPENLLNLSISHNLIATLSPTISNIRNLHYLDISHNALTSLCSELFKLPLEYLNISNNTIKEIPNEIGNLPNLIRLEMAHNPIVSLPAQLGKCTTLQALDITGLKETKFPPALVSLKKLTTLQLDTQILPAPLRAYPLNIPNALQFLCNR